MKKVAPSESRVITETARFARARGLLYQIIGDKLSDSKPPQLVQIEVGPTNPPCGGTEMFRHFILR